AMDTAMIHTPVSNRQAPPLDPDLDNACQAAAADRSRRAAKCRQAGERINSVVGDELRSICERLEDADRRLLAAQTDCDTDGDAQAEMDRLDALGEHQAAGES